MAGYQLSGRAERDVAELYEFSVEQFGLGVAQTYFLDLHNAFELLGANPMMGRAVDEVRGGLRRFVHQRHSIYYSIDESRVLIERVLHVARDAMREF
jgi:toxin ParE1/3/4